MLAHQCVTCWYCVAVISSALCAIHGERVAERSSLRVFALCPRRSSFLAGGSEQPRPPTRPTRVHGSARSIFRDHPPHYRPKLHCPLQATLAMQCYGAVAGPHAGEGGDSSDGGPIHPWKHPIDVRGACLFPCLSLSQGAPWYPWCHRDARAAVQATRGRLSLLLDCWEAYAASQHAPALSGLLAAPFGGPGHVPYRGGSIGCADGVVCW